MSASWTHEGRVLFVAYAGGAPALAVAIWLLVASELSAKVTWTLGAVVLVSWLVVPFVLRDRVTGPLRTLTSVLEAFREGDYSIKTRDHGDPGALGEAARELNALGEALRTHRLGAVEASTLVDRIVMTIDVAVIAVDDAGFVRLANPAAERLVGGPLVGEPARDVGLDPMLEGEAPRVVSLPLPGARGPLELRRSTFRQGGRAHTLLVLADVGRALRDKEREAWQRLVRVLGHEINSSLTPIQSITETVRALVNRPDRPDDWQEDVDAGLAIIGRRAGALARFLSAYACLAKLPPPTLSDVAIAELVDRTARLEQRLMVEVSPGPPLHVLGDADQLDQALINLVKNAAEAALEARGGVRVSWAREGDEIAIHVDDDGPGLSETLNLFVPFFTTKEGGSGVGVGLARSIAEGHGGTVTLTNRSDGRGARATLRLPEPRSSTVTGDSGVSSGSIPAR